MECSKMFVIWLPYNDPVNVLVGIGNTPSIKFYESIGAENLGKEWQVMRLANDTLATMAKRGPEVERC